MAQNGLTKRAPDAGDSGAIPSLFLHLSIFPVGRRSAARPSAGNANRWAFEHGLNIMKKNISATIFSFIFLIGCLSNSVNQPVNTYPSTMDVSAFQTSAVQTVYAEAMSTVIPTETLTYLPTLTSTSISNATPTATFILMYSDVLGKNCNPSDSKINLSSILLNMVTQLPSDIITPPPGIDFDTGRFLGDGENYCYFISIPRKSDHLSFDGYAFWNGKGNIIYWTEGVVSGGGNETIYSYNSGGWYWLRLLTLTKEMEVQMLTPEYLRPTIVP